MLKTAIADYHGQLLTGEQLDLGKKHYQRILPNILYCVKVGKL